MASAKSPCVSTVSLVSKVKASVQTVNAVSTIPGEDSMMSASDDKTVQVWVKKENNQFWPSIIKNFEASCSALACEREEEGDGHIVFVGLGNGQIQEFRMSRDLNRFEKRRTFLGHSHRVTDLKLVPSRNWIFSTGRDKRLQWNCTKSNRNLGSYEAGAWCLAVEYDDTDQYVFIAEYNGDITILLAEERNFQRLTQLKGHTGSVWALSYDPERRMLFSGGFDRTIIVWDIGSQRGTAYELSGHTGKIRALKYSHIMRKLLSTAEDGKLGVWDMDQDRLETAEWAGSNFCEKCGIPFFWNFRGMWQKKTLGMRQHHCRKCGRALCSRCSDQQSTYPRMGFERPVRMCQDCHSTITTDDCSPMATFINLNVKITSVSILQGQGLMVTGNDDKTLRVWDISNLMD